MRERDPVERQPIRGWLLLLCMLLLVWGPVQLALAASTALGALSIRGLPLGLLLFVRVAVAGLGVAAGLALLTRQGSALPLARGSLLLSAAIDIFVYATRYFPSNRMPGDTVFYVAGSIAYCSAWLLYLWRSKRVRRTY